MKYHKHLPSFFSHFPSPLDIFDEDEWEISTKPYSNLSLSEDKTNFYVEAALPRT